MNTIHKTRPALLTALALAALLAWPAAQAASMSKADYSAGKTRIGADYKAEKESCKVQNGNSRDICVEEAKGREKIARAELEFGYSAKAGDRNKVLVAKADATYNVAREKCDDLAGNLKDVCVKEAKAVRAKALADAKLAMTVGTATTDAAQTKRDADYKVAAEKCESMAGDAKTNCVAAAKAHAGKS